MRSLHGGPHSSGLPWWSRRSPLVQCVRERHHKWWPRKRLWMQECRIPGPCPMQSRLLHWRHCQRRFLLSSPLDEHVQLHCAHFVHQSWWLNLCGRYRFLQMQMKDRFSRRSSLDLQILFLLSSAISLSNLLSFLVQIYLRLLTGKPHAHSSNLQFF